MPILFGKHKCQVKLWWATCSDAHPCFHPTPPSFRYQLFGTTKPVGKKRTRVYRHLPQVSACQALFKPKGNHSRTPGADWWPAISQLSRLAILWYPFYILHPSVHSLDTNTCGSTKPFGKKRTRVYNHLPQVSACQVLFKPKGNHSRTPGADWWPAISQLSRLAILWHPFYILHPSVHSLDTNTFGSTKPFGKKDAGL